jgi:hypothetical protein
MRISRLIESNRVAREDFDPEKGDSMGFYATLLWNEGELKKGIGINPAAPSPIPSRTPYDEAVIVSRATFHGATVSTTYQGNNSVVRTIVALNKALLIRLLSPTAPGQWLFVRLDLNQYVELFRELRIVHRASVGLAAVSSTIEIDGKTVGSLVFSWWKK